jgi:KUP system potassium uptake protein
VPADLVDDDNPGLARVARTTTPAAALAALGIVYGDLGTSPLYTLQAVVGATGGHFSSEAALGTLSLIFWALTITISVKYCLFVMRADNHGEGGILALMSMTGANWSEGGRVLIVMGLFGAALLYGDGIITPAISVLSALEGLNVATEVFKPHVVFMAVAILLALFAIQKPRHRADRQGVGSGNAAVVRGHCGVGYRRRFPPPRRDRRRRSALRDRAAD